MSLTPENRAVSVAAAAEIMESALGSGAAAGAAKLTGSRKGIGEDSSQCSTLFFSGDFRNLEGRELESCKLYGCNPQDH